MKKFTAILLIFIQCFLIFGCSTTDGGRGISTINANNSKIESVLKEIFNAYNSNDSGKISSVGEKYIDKELFGLIFNGKGTNIISVDGTVISGTNLAFKKFTFTLDDYSMDIHEDTAAVTGFVSGSVSLTKNENKRGPWKMNSLFYKSDDSWYVEHLNLKKVEVPKLEYYTQLPENYSKDTSKKWPLIVFLHGIGERGGGLEDIKGMSHSIPKIAATAKDFPFVAVSPLLPAGVTWQDVPYSVNNLIDDVIEKYSVDPGRIYLTGLSLGGMGTWSIARQYPERFAAIAPVCGTLNPTSALRLKGVPVWAFHGALDTIVTMDDEANAISTLKSNGGDVKYTIYPDVEHDAWVRAYNTPELYEWFQQHKRR